MKSSPAVEALAAGEVSIYHFHVVAVADMAIVMVDGGKCKPVEERDCMLGLAEALVWVVVLLEV